MGVACWQKLHNMISISELTRSLRMLEDTFDRFEYYTNLVLNPDDPEGPETGLYMSY